MVDRNVEFGDRENFFWAKKSTSSLLAEQNQLLAPPQRPRSRGMRAATSHWAASGVAQTILGRLPWKQSRPLPPSSSDCRRVTVAIHHQQDTTSHVEPTKLHNLNKKQKGSDELKFLSW